MNEPQIANELVMRLQQLLSRSDARCQIENWTVDEGYLCLDRSSWFYCCLLAGEPDWKYCHSWRRTCNCERDATLVSSWFWLLLRNLDFANRIQELQSGCSVWGASSRWLVFIYFDECVLGIMLQPRLRCAFQGLWSCSECSCLEAVRGCAWWCCV